MDIIEAIGTRISIRAFEERAIAQDALDELAAELARVNEESGFNFQLYGPREDGTALDLSPRMFANNPPAYLALVGPAGEIPEERLGYYGEKLVLKATQLGLGSCWVAGTFDRSTTRAELADGEKLHDVIPLGYAPRTIPIMQRTIRAAIRARSKKDEAMWKGPTKLAQAPEWIRACIDGVNKAPSAVNEQPVVFVQDEPDGPIRAELPRVKSGMEYTDLGIAKLHFELIARECGIEGGWEWGAGGAFVIA